MVKTVEQGIAKGATPLTKGETSGLPNRPIGAAREEERIPAEVTSLARVRARKIEPKSEIIEQIGKRLRNVYNEVLFQPVPDRFHDLIRALETGGETKANTAVVSSDEMGQKDLK